MAEELKGWKWKEQDLRERPKGDWAKVARAARFRRETTLTIRECPLALASIYPI